MIHRIITKSIQKTVKTMPSIAILGPRQSGKTTLAQTIFPDYTYVNLEIPENRRFAQNDPQAFLSQYSRHVILDEVQRVPELFSYLQVKMDQDKIPCQYVLTGSQHFLMLSDISQTLAGRIAIFNLYPLSYEELASKNLQPKSITEQLWSGSYPALYDRKIDPNIWHSSYIQTYLERDISLIANIADLKTFETFLHLVAGRSGALLNLSSLSADTGVTHNTIKSWINLLETSGIIFLLKPYHRNLNKRVIKTPKLYFIDTGLMCYLLGINQPQQLPTHPLYGAIFETFIVSEFLKYQSNHQTFNNLFFWRNKEGLEADIVLERGSQLDLFEVKSAQTIPHGDLSKLNKIRTTINSLGVNTLIYSGQDQQKRESGRIIPWQQSIS